MLKITICIYHNHLKYLVIVFSLSNTQISFGKYFHQILWKGLILF